jgi:hypothetical protein
MIIYVILVALVVVTVVGAIVTYNSYHEELNAVLTVACIVSFTGLIVFNGLDYGTYRKNVEAVNVVGTIEDKYTTTRETSENTWKTVYWLDVECDGEEKQEEVSWEIYDKWEAGQQIEGQKVYYTTGFTNINTYEYVWAF